MDIKQDHKKPLIGLKKIPTCKQLERTISQRFYAFYRQQLGCSPQQVTCTIFNNYLVIVTEEAMTPLEQTIKETGQIEILVEIRQSINRVLKSQLKKLIEELTMVKVVDLICDLNFDSGRMMAIAILIEAPQIRGLRYRESARRANGNTRRVL